MIPKKSTSHMLPLIAVAVVVTAFAITFLPYIISNKPSIADTSDSGELVFSTTEIGATASYFPVETKNGIIEVFAVRAQDDSVRLALNTCQVCNGSPYAYFVQTGDFFICQNCGNAFATNSIGEESGGCNPVPITHDVYREENGIITIPASFLEENAYRFVNWKQF